MRIIPAISVMFVLALASCGNKDEGEPAEWLLYFSFVDNNGNDFFEQNPENYSSDSVFVKIGNVEFEFDDRQVLNDEHIYGFASWGAGSVSQANRYISFGNGDYDTLHYEWEPTSLSFSQDKFEKLSVVKFYYNGVLIETWKPKSDPDMLQDLVNRNTPRYPATSTLNPIVLKLPKGVDENEFH